MTNLYILLNQYQEENEIIKSNFNNFLKNIIKLDLNNNLIEQLSLEKVALLENIINLFNFDNKFIIELQDSFKYYRENHEILKDLIFHDSKYQKLDLTISKLYQEYDNFIKKNIQEYNQQLQQLELKINKIKQVINLLNNNLEVKIDDLKEILTDISLPDDLYYEIFNMVLKKNFEIYQMLSIKENDKIKEEKNNIPEVIDTITLNNSELDLGQEKNTEYNFDISDDEILNLIKENIKKVEICYEKIDVRNNFTKEKHLNLYELNNIKYELENLQKDFEFCLEHQNLDISLDEKLELNIEKKRILISLSNIIENIDKLLLSFTEGKIDLNQDNDSINNLIFLDKVINDDLSGFKKGKCDISISRKIENVIQNLRNNTVPRTSKVFYNKVNKSSNSRVIEYHVSSSSGGVLRLFYEQLDNMIIVLLIGVEGKIDHNRFSNILDSRISSNEYLNFIKSYKLSKQKPNVSGNTPKKQTNLEYFDELLNLYKERDNEFMEIYYNECCPKSKKK